MTTPAHIPDAKRTWPKAYLLDIYAKAIEHGAVVLQPISEAHAASLKGALYRQRRRSDNSNKTFITTEMHLVTVGKWHSTAGGTLPIYYNKVPESEGALPDINPLIGDDLHELLAPRQHASDINIPEKLAGLDDIDVSDYVNNLIRDSKKET